MLRRLMMIGWITVMMCPALSYAEKIGGVDIPDSLTAGNTPLVLNGAGLRKKFFMNIYAGALYLHEKSHDARKIIEAEEPMAIRMHFIYDGVSRKKLIDTWNEGFDNGTDGKTAPIAPQLEKFNACFTEDAKAGDVYDFIYTPSQGVRVYKKKELRGAIQGIAFKKALFAIWLGENPADEDLKEGMLGY